MTRSDWKEICNEELCALGIQNFSALEICDVGRTANGVALEAPSLDLLANAIQLIDVLQWVRDQGVPAPVLINSWYRSPSYNASIGGVEHSMHLTCGAADIVKVGYSPERVAAMLEWHPLSNQLGIGQYASFTHIDIRGMMGRHSPARW